MSHIVAFDLISGKKTLYTIPGRIFPGGIDLIDVQTLRRKDPPSISGFRLAYSLPGDCDPAITPPVDMTQPSGTPDYTRVCFLTLPYTPPQPPRPPAAASKRVQHPTPKTAPKP